MELTYRKVDKVSSGKAETREAIFQAARKLIENHGPSAVRMQDIAEEAGISRQGLYLHFESRTDLLLRLVEWIDTEQGLGDRMRWVWRAPDGVTALERFLSINAHYTHKIYHVAQSLMSGRYADEAIARTWQDRMKGRRRTCRRLIEWVREEGRLAPSISVGEATDMLWTTISVQVWEQLILECNWTEEQYQHHLMSALKSSLLAGMAETA